MSSMITFYTQLTVALHLTIVILFFIQQLKDKLTISYLKLSNYISPLYMAYSYEEAHGHKYTVLASVLRETSFFLNSTVSTLRHEVIFSLINKW